MNDRTGVRHPPAHPLHRAAGRALVGAGVATAVARLLPGGGTARWQRTNHRGVPVSLASGPALALAVAAGAALPQPSAAVAGLVAGAVGAYDDAVGGRDDAKGFRGHLGALRRGRLTAGVVKVAGIGGAGLVSVALLPGRRSPVDILLGGATVAGAANLLNLLDLRPGRALKAGGLAAAGLRQPGLVAAAAALLPGDLGERTMLGDAGANAFGAVLGLALVERPGSRRASAATLAALVALTAASEFMSYSRVIDAVLPLRALDRLGRRT